MSAPEGAFWPVNNPVWSVTGLASHADSYGSVYGVLPSAPGSVSARTECGSSGADASLNYGTDPAPRTMMTDGGRYEFSCGTDRLFTNVESEGYPVGVYDDPLGSASLFYSLDGIAWAPAGGDFPGQFIPVGS
ncbi:MAG TPA: hypothetical protein PL033_13060 [Candidatus Brocadiia bacterium]|nr:hypothetical protein [Candidatus Brocadiia bacterium]